MLEKKKVLGRGLEALIGKVREEAPAASQQETRGAREEAGGKRFYYTPLENVRPNARQPRKTFDRAALRELADSIVEKGIIEPLIVRVEPGTGKLELIAGERRLRAAELAGLKEVPVVTIEATDEESLELAIIENIQRENLNAMEEAEAYRHLMGFGLSQAEVAFRVGKGRATVANYMRLLGLPEEVKEAIRDDSVSMGHARAILSLDSMAARLGLLRQIISKGLSVRDAERLARRGGVKKAKPSASAPDPAIKGLEDELCRAFSTRIHVKEKKGKGSIEILYFSPDERERIIELLRGVAERA
ncbi:MAG: ParB/RepB/Spo0J family partition protein [Thermodesulfobacteriota bacterium]